MRGGDNGQKAVPVCHARADAHRLHSEHHSAPAYNVPSQPQPSALQGADFAAWALMVRRMREEVIGAQLFSDPAWDILLDLYVARVRGHRVQTSSLSPMAAVPPSTARRWVRKLIDLGLLERERDRTDQRLAFLKLTTKGYELMIAFMARLGAKGQPPTLRP